MQRDRAGDRTAVDDAEREGMERLGRALHRRLSRAAHVEAGGPGKRPGSAGQLDSLLGRGAYADRYGLEWRQAEPRTTLRRPPARRGDRDLASRVPRRVLEAREERARAGGANAQRRHTRSRSKNASTDREIARRTRHRQRLGRAGLELDGPDSRSPDDGLGDRGRCDDQGRRRERRDEPPAQCRSPPGGNLIQRARRIEP